MAPRVNLSELGDGYLGVESRGFQFLVAQELLDEADVRSTFKHVSRAGVAEKMATPLSRQSGGSQHCGNHV